MVFAPLCALTAFQTPLLTSHRPLGRVTDPSMTHQLNNYVLDGPLNPLGDQVLVRLSPVDEATESGLILTSAAAEKPKEGVIVAAGPGRMNPQTCTLDENPYKPGDLVLLSEYTGEKVQYDDDKHVMLSADAVLGKFSGDAALADSFEPGMDRLLVRLEQAAAETSSGIVLAGLEEEDSNHGEVVAVGRKASAVAIGDRILYDKWAASDAVLEGRRYKLVPAGKCFAKW